MFYQQNESKRLPPHHSQRKCTGQTLKGKTQLRVGRTASRRTATTDTLTPWLKPLGWQKTGRCGKPLWNRTHHTSQWWCGWLKSSQLVLFYFLFYYCMAQDCFVLTNSPSPAPKVQPEQPLGVVWRVPELLKGVRPEHIELIGVVNLTIGCRDTQSETVLKVDP